MNKIFSFILLTFFSVTCVAHEPDEKFSFSLAHRVFKNKGNVFISPYSAKIALSMAMHGATGKTYGEMLQVLGTSSPSIIDGGGFNSYQAMAVHQGYPLLKSYLDSVTKDYQAAIFKVDFINQKELAVHTINRWVETSTKGLIPKLLTDVAPDTKFVLLNACHFKNKWLSSFRASETHKATFTTSIGGKVEVDMMYQTNTLKYAKDNTTAYLELDFKEPKYNCLLILPDDPKKLVQLEKHLDAAKLKKVESLLNHGHIDLYLPKLDIEYEIQLNDALQMLGIKEAFTNAATFTKMTANNDLFIDTVFQKARLQIDEEGVKAAATTYTGFCMGIPTPVEATLRFDHPFLILIREKKSGTILFLGRISNPASQE
jgi:serpin B